MKRKIVKILLWLLIAGLLLFLISAVLLYLNREKLQGLVVREVNKQLVVPVSVADIEISMRKFPSASFLLKEVYSQGAFSEEGDTLIYAKRLYLQFDIWRVLTSDISINKISLEEGRLNIIRKENGENNYEIWHNDTASSSGVFELNEFNITDMQTTYFDGNIDLHTAFYIQNTSFKGVFGRTVYWLENEGQIQLENLYLKDEKYLSQIPVGMSFILNSKNGVVSIDNATADLDDIHLSFEVDLKEETEVRAQMHNADLGHLQALAARQSWYINEDLDVQGEGSADFRAKFSEGKEVELTLAFRAAGAHLGGYRNTRISDVKCSGLYEMARGKSNISIKEFSGKGRSGKIRAKLDIQNISDPYVVLDLKSDLDFSEWLVLFPVDTVTEPAGRAMVDLHFENKFSSLSKLHASELRRARAQGELTIESASFRFKGAGKKVEDINGELSFSGNDLKVERLYFHTGKSDIFLDGIFSNVLNFILIEDQTLEVDCRVKSQDIDLGDFIGEKTESTGGEYSLSFAKALDLRLALEVDRFVFNEFRATDIAGKLLIQEEIIRVDDLRLKADKGVYTGTFTVDTRDPERYYLRAKLLAEDISIHDLFRSFRNFDQDAISAENIEGIATASATMNAEMTPAMEVLPASVNLTSSLEISNGRLRNYDPMLALSRFAEIEELRDVQFKSLRNNITIRNSEVIIPDMEINSSVLDLQIGGVHGFDNHIDYTMRLKLGDVLFSKRKGENRGSELDEHLVEKEHDDDPFIYVKMHGRASDPKIELDKKSLRKSISQDLKQQGEELKTIFGKERQKEEKKDPGIIYEWPEEDGN